jgi:hypothetical protein
MNENAITTEPAHGSQLAKAEAEAKKFDLDQRKAMVYAKSTLVPDHYKDHIGNTMVALKMAERLNADVLMVMQNLYIVHGKPAWSAQFMIACFNTSNNFTAIKYRLNEEKTECVAYCTEILTGEVIESPMVSLAMAEAEKWSTKSGSKWKNLSELMLRYRSATYLIRTTAPQILMGLQTRSEVDDTNDDKDGNTVEGSFAPKSTSLNSAMKAIEVQVDEKKVIEDALQEAENSAVMSEEIPKYVQEDLRHQQLMGMQRKGE